MGKGNRGNHLDALRAGGHGNLRDLFGVERESAERDD